MSANLKARLKRLMGRLPNPNRPCKVCGRRGPIPPDPPADSVAYVVHCGGCRWPTGVVYEDITPEGDDGDDSYPGKGWNDEPTNPNAS